MLTYKIKLIDKSLLQAWFEKYLHLLIFIQYIIRFSDIVFNVYNPVISAMDL